MTRELVCIYVSANNTIADFDRDFGWRLLEDKLALDVDLLERSQVSIDPKGKRKHSSTGRAITVFAERANLEAILSRLRAIDPDAKAYAVAVVGGNF